MKKVVIIIILFFSGSYLKAQTNSDSLRAVWHDSALPDSIRLKAISQLISNLEASGANMDSILIIADKMVHYAHQAGQVEFQIKGLLFKSKIYSGKLNFKKGIALANQALKLANEISYIPGIADAYSVLSVISYRAGDFSKMFLYEKQSLNNWRKTNDIRRIAWGIHNLGYAYQELGDYNNAISLYEEGLTFSIQHKQLETQSNCLIYLGESHQLKGQYEVGQNYFKEALAIIEANNFALQKPWLLAKMGEGLLALKKNKDAFEVCKKAYDLASFEGDAKHVACLCLYKSSRNLGNYYESLLYYEKWNELNKNLNKTETNKALLQIDFKHQLLLDSLRQIQEKRLIEDAHQEEVRQKNNTRNMLAVGGLLLVILAGGTYNRLRYTRKAKAIIEKEKDRSDDLLLNILPADIAEELKIHGKAEARDFDKASILFTDFKGFTEASSNMSARMLVGEINACFEAFDRIIEEYGIEKIKTIGDAYMAAGGLPVPFEGSIKSTVLAALEMQEFMARDAGHTTHGTKSPKPGTSRLFEMRVGIHTGPVVAGIVGVKKFQYDIWGDTVNTASRMESYGEVGKVNISQATYELLKDDPHFVFENRGKIEAKGKGEMGMFFVSLRK